MATLSTHKLTHVGMYFNFTDLLQTKPIYRMYSDRLDESV